MTHGSLFSGIGGFDLAAEWMGWENIFHCEWNPFGQKVLKHHFPNSISYADITKTDFTVHAGKIDVLTGGFPCQPFSAAGKRKGTDDARYLWPEMLRCIREVRPRWVVGENVYGLVSWDGGVVLDKVCTDLENEGFKILPVVLPAASVNAPHQRNRIWFIAYSNNARANIGLSSEREWSQSDNNRGFTQSEFGQNDVDGDVADTKSQRINGINGGYIKEKREDRSRDDKFNGIGNIGDVTDSNSTNSEAWTQREVLGQSDREKANGYSNVECRNKWQNFPTVSPICDANDGLSNQLDSITFSKWRNESIKAGGNAIVPQVVYQIFKAIEQYENL